MPVEPEVKRAVAFFDGQNLFHAAREAFGYTFPNYDPVVLAQRLCGQMGWVFRGVRFYTGVPDARDNQGWHHFRHKKRSSRVGRGRVSAPEAGTAPAAMDESAMRLGPGQGANEPTEAHIVLRPGGPAFSSPGREPGVPGQREISPSPERGGAMPARTFPPIGAGSLPAAGRREPRLPTRYRHLRPDSRPGLLRGAAIGLGRPFHPPGCLESATAAVITGEDALTPPRHPSRVFLSSVLGGT